MPELAGSVEKAAKLIVDADAIIITAGAGIGVDSGLPDFRGGAGFWGAYPALGRARLHFDEIATPQAFVDVPDLAWGFYGHRLNLYRATVPHPGFQMLLDISARLPSNSFVFTSNVDGQFQKAGFEGSRIIECHGSIHHLQCPDGCEEHVWSADSFRPEIDEAECRIRSSLPKCPHCRKDARPNILMFNDWAWLPNRKYEQQLRYRRWRASVSRPVVIEVGAGTAIPSVRDFGEEQGCPVIRINPREADIHGPQDVSLPLGGHAGVAAICDVLARTLFFERPIVESEAIEEFDYIEDFD